MDITIAPFDILILSLAIARVSLFIAMEDGPFRFMDKVRYLVGVRPDETGLGHYGTNTFAEGLICYRCNSFWVALVVGAFYVFLPDWAMVMSWPLAFSMVAYLIGSYVDR